MSTNKMTVRGVDVKYERMNNSDYISLTDLAKYKAQKPDLVIGNWIRTRNTIDYLAAWETLHNPVFNTAEIAGFRSDCSLNTFGLSPKRWIEATGAIGIVSKAGKYCGTYAHKDIAFKFASWLSVEFELYVIKEFQRLKENEQKALEWTAKRELAKVNYRIHTDAIKEYLIVPELTPKQISFVYANEADLLNVALFGMTAGEWRMKNPDEKGNMRDHAGVEQLLVLANMESYNAILIEEKRPQSERIVLLNKTARKQLETLLKAQIDRSKLLGQSKDSDKEEKK
jgi:hypothetical protein